MKILVFGAGVLGCNLARNLCRAGKDVTLLARGKWAEEIKQNGLRIKNQLLPFPSVTHIPVVTELSPDAAYDVIFVVVRYTQLENLLEPLRKSRAENIVFVGNNLRTDALVAQLSIDLKKITIGQLRTSPSNKALIDEIFAGTRYKVVYQPNMGDYLLCHAAFVTPAAFACYKTDGNLKKLKGNTAYLCKMVDANIEAYRAIRDAGHEILPDADKAFESDKYRKVCLRFFKLMAATSLGKVCASDHAMSATDEMSALNRDLKQFFDANGADYPVWRALEKECGKYLK